MTAQRVDAAPTTNVRRGLNPIKGIMKKNGTLNIGLNHACRSETKKFISSLE